MDNSDLFSAELDQMIEQASQGREVVSMDETQRRQVILAIWLKNMEPALRALRKNRKVFLVNDGNGAADTIHILLAMNSSRQPDRMYLKADYSSRGTPEEIAKLVTVEYWPTFFPEDEDNYDDPNGGEVEFGGTHTYDIASLQFKRELASFITNRLEG